MLAKLRLPLEPFAAIKKIDIENARKPEISKDSESKFTKGGKTQK